MPVEAAAAMPPGTMEITVSKFELLRELTATQGVVERKTTIPILSNYLFEAAGDKLSITATDLDLSLRTSCSAKVKKEGLVHHSGAQALRLRQAASRWRHHHQAAGEPLGQHSLRALEHKDGRHGAVEFPRLPVFPTAGAIKIPAQVLRSMIAKTRFAIANEESRYTLNGALMVLKPESITMVPPTAIGWRTSSGRQKSSKASPAR